MDIKKRRRNDWPIEGNYEGSETQGNQASDNNIGWDVRAQGWQRGADTDFRAIDDEKREEDLKYGVPCADVLSNPADRNPKDGPLPNPHNFSSNPGFMSASTADMAVTGAPANGRTANVQTAGAGGPTAKVGPTAGRSLRRGSSGGSGSVGLVGVRKGTAGGTAAIAPSPGTTGTVGRTAQASAGNAALPAPGDVNPGQEGGPQVVTSGYSG